MAISWLRRAFVASLRATVAGASPREEKETLKERRECINDV